MRNLHTTMFTKLLSLLDIATKDRPLLEVMELMLHGDWNKFLKKNRPVDKENLSDQNVDSNCTTAPIKTNLHPVRPICEMAIEIAVGNVSKCFFRALTSTRRKRC